MLASCYVNSVTCLFVISSCHSIYSCHMRINTKLACNRCCRLCQVVVVILYQYYNIATCCVNSVTGLYYSSEITHPLSSTHPKCPLLGVSIIRESTVLFVYVYQ